MCDRVLALKPQELYNDIIPAGFAPLSLQLTENRKFRLGLTIDAIPTVYEINTIKNGRNEFNVDSPISLSEQQRLLVFEMIKKFTIEWVEFISDQFAVQKLQVITDYSTESDFEYGVNVCHMS